MTRLTQQQARELGFDYVKIHRSCPEIDTCKYVQSDIPLVREIKRKVCEDDWRDCEFRNKGEQE